MATGFRKRTALALIMAMALPLMSCGNEEEAESDGPIEFTTIAQWGTYDRQFPDRLKKPTLLRFDDAGSFSEFWERLNSSTIPLPPPPEIDFTASTVLALLDITKPHAGDTIKVREISRSEGLVSVYGLQTEAGAWCLAHDTVTQPTHVVAIAKTSSDIVLWLDIERILCDEDTFEPIGKIGPVRYRP